MTNQHDVIIIGGGLAGLSCAVKLASAKKRVALLEATDRIGGRVRSDVVDGFTLDHGFQVLLTAYPACRELLDYPALRLRAFDPGALIRVQGKFSLLGDPWRRPSQALSTALSPVGTFGDKLRIGGLRKAAKRGSLDDVYSRPSTTTLKRLEQDGFTPAMIDRFFRPFMGGVFLDESLTTSSRMLEFVFRMFSSGDIAIPADGMGAIPRQLADSLPKGTVRLQNTVAKITDRSVALTNGETLTANHVVVATESSAASRLLGIEKLDTKWSTATTFYYAADQAPDDRKLLMLRGDEPGVIQSAVVLSNIAPEYASAGKSLISVSVSDSDHDTDTETLDQLIRGQMMAWFGDQVSQWRRLHVYRVPYGLPKTDLESIIASVDGPSVGAVDGVFVCGDHRETPSIQGAMNSGMRTAAAILS